MAEQIGGGPFDNSADTSVARFEARQKHYESVEGQVAAGQRLFAAEDKLAKAEEANQEPKPTHISVIELLGLPIAKIKEWFRK